MLSTYYYSKAGLKIGLADLNLRAIYKSGPVLTQSVLKEVIIMKKDLQEITNNPSLEREKELKESILDYTEVNKFIETGMTCASRNHENRAKILEYFGASLDDWDNWKWQMKNRIASVEELKQILDLSQEEVNNLNDITAKLRWAISPYYLSLVDFNNFRESPIYRQAIPSLLELQDDIGERDPMGEEKTNPAPQITRRYPDRLIINVTNQCAMYCRHCQRRRSFGEVDKHASIDNLKEALKYVENNPEIRDVLITGGDALLLSNDVLDWLLTELDKIDHVEIKRLGSRVPVTLPQRVTPELCEILKKHPPIYINSQFNLPLEVTPEAKKACDRLIEAGVVLGNQAVLLKNINDDVHIMKKLNQELLKIRVRPYYLFQAKHVEGTAHFIAPVQKGIEITQKLRGFTSGLAVPTYIINAPGGYGKTPMTPSYLQYIDDEEVIFKTWQDKTFHYPNKGE